MNIIKVTIKQRNNGCTVTRMLVNKKELFKKQINLSYTPILSILCKSPMYGAQSD